MGKGEVEAKAGMPGRVAFHDGRGELAMLEVVTRVEHRGDL